MFMEFPNQFGSSFYQKLSRRLHARLQRRVKSFKMYLPFLYGKYGLEIGGPSNIFRKRNALPVYSFIDKLDNCDYSCTTVWANHAKEYVVNPNNNPGKVFICEGLALAEIPDKQYDVLLSSHNLEHFANPVKALKEWQRVLKPNGALILVLPYYLATFDHFRRPTDVDHMFLDYEMNIGEDDLTHLSEILAKHDLSMDPLAGSFDQFHKRSLNNYFNRCLHHHVFDQHNIRELVTRTGYEVLAIDFIYPFHLCVLSCVSSPKTC